MIEKLSNNTGLKMIVLKALAYLLLIVSIVMFGKGWITFQSSRVRRDITKGVTNVVAQLQSASQSDWDQINDYLADYDLEISGEEMVEKEIEALRVIEDAEVSPKEAMIFVTRSSWLFENAGEIIGVEETQETRKNIARIKTYSILLQVLYYLTILAFIGAVVSMVTTRGIGTYAYSIMIAIQFILFAVFKSRVNTFLKSSFDAIGISVSSENLAMRFCGPAFGALICAILTCIVWSMLLFMSSTERTTIPGVIMLTGKMKNRDEVSKILPKGVMCPCGTQLGKNDKFCPVCGRKVVRNVPNTCKKCNAVLEPDSLFCGNCGSRQVADDDDQTVNTAMLSRKKEITLVNSEDRSQQVKGVLQNGATLNVGRADNMDLMVDFSRSISRKHCRVFMQDGEIYVEDLNSTYKTYVDDQMINTPHLIKNGSTLTLGKCRLEVCM